MHCLYCDRPLALLKRLTGDGEFCSKEHRRIYQQEHNQLALARLLESQPKPKEKLRPEKVRDVKPEPAIVEPVKTREAPQPKLAGFVPESLDAGAVPAGKRFSNAPRFQLRDPVWGGIAAASGFQDRFGQGPKTAGFLGAPSGAGSAGGATRLQDKFDYKKPVGKLLLEAKGLSAAGGSIRRSQPAGAGFKLERPAGQPPRETTRRFAEARFSPFVPVMARVPWTRRASKLRMAAFRSGFALERTAPGRIRMPAIETRWKPLSPALPVQAPGKIVLVLGSFLQRPVRPASQDALPETFEIPFLPISYPQFSPRMGCLEERLHRTDRIGFSPP
jgi:hypothetical protein